MGQRRGDLSKNLMVRDVSPYHDLSPGHFDRLATNWLSRYYVHCLEKLRHRINLDAGAEVVQGCPHFLRKLGAAMG